MKLSMLCPRGGPRDRVGTLNVRVHPTWGILTNFDVILNLSPLHFEQNAQRYGSKILCKSVVITMCDDITALVA